MSILVQGTLRNPQGEPLANQEIRITSKHTESTVKGVNRVYGTNSIGEYSFPLLDGVYLLEVLVDLEYILTGDLRVDDSTPDPITLEQLVQYSTPIQLEELIDFPPNWDIPIDQLENGVNTRNRELREQIVDDGSDILEVSETYTNSDINSYSSKRTEQLISNDTLVQGQEMILTDTDDSSIAFASKSTVVKSGSTQIEEAVFVEPNKIAETEKRSAAGNTVERAETLDTGVTKSETITTSTTSEVSSKSHTANSVQETKTVNSDDVVRQVLTLLSDNGIDQNQVMKVLSTDQTNGVESSESFTVQGKDSSVSHTNDGTISKVEINSDGFVVQRIGNTTFEVDTVNDVVYVRGQLRVERLEDGNGNPIDPDDGDTIFLTYQYAETPNGPWHDDRLPADEWARQTWSRNGVLDPWGAAYRISPSDGSDGDTIFWEYNYSPDGIGSWTPELKAGDRFRRERRVVNGVPEAWSNPAPIKGDNGDSIEIRSQYSIDGVYNWHDTLDPADRFERRARFVNGVIDSPWSNPFPIGRGEDAINQATIFLYQRGTTTPAKPNGDLVYTFSTQTLTGDLNGWLREVPAGTGNIYTAIAVASDTGDSDTIADTEWNIQLWSEAGYNSAIVYLFQRGTSAPAAPDTTLTWDYATGRFTDPVADLDGWEYSIPAGSDPVWLCIVNVYSNTPTDTVDPNEWQVVQQGATGLNQANLIIFNRSVNQPAAPSGTVTYTFGSGQYTGLTGGWSATPPSGTDPLWLGSASAISYGATDDIAPSEWDVAKWIESGFQGARIDIYQTSASQPTLLPTGSVYYYNTGQLTFADANGWSATVPDNSAGKVWVATVFVTAYAGVPSENIAQNQWSTPTLLVEEGYQSQEVSLYRTTSFEATNPSPTSAGVTYNFVTKTATGGNNGWSPDYPASSNGKIWFQRGVARTTISDDDDWIPASEFSAPQVLVQDGRELALVNLYALDTTTKFVGTCVWYKATNNVNFPSDTNTPWSTEYPESTPGTKIYQMSAAKLASNQNNTVEFQASEFSEPKVVGGTGSDGDGTPGSGWYYIEGNGGVFPSDSVAATAMFNKYGRLPVLDDHLFYVDNEDDPTKTDGKRCISDYGTPVGEIRFSTPAVYVDGDMIVKGTLSADRIVANSLTGNEISSQTTIIAGSGSWTVGMNGSDASTLPPWLGGGSNKYQYWRLWSGAEDPANANFRVNRNGRLYAGDLHITGRATVTDDLVVGSTGAGDYKAVLRGSNQSAQWMAFGAGVRDPDNLGNNMLRIDHDGRLRMYMRDPSNGDQDTAAGAIVDFNPFNRTFVFKGTVLADRIDSDVIAYAIKNITGYTLSRRDGAGDSYRTIASGNIGSSASSSTRTVLFPNLPTAHVSGGHSQASGYHQYARLQIRVGSNWYNCPSIGKESSTGNATFARTGVVLPGRAIDVGSGGTTWEVRVHVHVEGSSYYDAIECKWISQTYTPSIGRKGTSIT